jgi:hypothetical protein
MAYADYSSMDGLARNPATAGVTRKDSDVQELDVRVAALERRLLALEDERAIRDLLAQYAYYADAGLDEQFYALFTTDAVMDVSIGRGPRPYDTVQWAGIDEIKEFLAVRTAAHGDGFVGRSQHVQADVSITVDGDAAKANSYSFIIRQTDLDVRLVSASVNEWTFARVGGTWLVGERKRRMLGSEDLPRVLQATSERGSMTVQASTTTAEGAS